MTELKAISKAWGFEGCGAMWTFFSDEKRARASAGGNAVFEFTLEEAFELDNYRRKELGHNKVQFAQFIDCIDATASCVIPELDC